jgi:proteasome lid subunit RPN8/RPN11
MIINYQVEADLLQFLKKKCIESDIEICGFIKKKNNTYSWFIESKNLHPDPANFFLISPREYIDNEESILFHSHPGHCKTKGFSEWDLENQKYFALTMLLYSVNDDKFYYSYYD